MRVGLVGSEMCIRDRSEGARAQNSLHAEDFELYKNFNYYYQSSVSLGLLDNFIFARAVFFAYIIFFYSVAFERMLKILTTGSHSIVRTQENTTHTDRNG